MPGGHPHAHKAHAALGKTIIRAAAKARTAKRKSAQGYGPAGASGGNGGALDGSARGGGGSTGFHVADLEHSRNPLQSVTEVSSMEEFMAAASMAERDFKAERANVRIISDDGAPTAALRARGAAAGSAGVGVGPGSARGGSFGPLSTAALHDTPSGALRSMRIPRRPVWDGKTSAADLHRAEKDAFLEWRRSLAAEELRHGAGVLGAQSGADEAHVTPFEKNIEVWRQLWRVVERSDVLVQIVDARNPLLFRCNDLEAYVRDVNPLKSVLLLVNKADFLTPRQRLAWARHFAAEGTHFVFFSAKREQERLEALDRMQRGLPPKGEDSDEAWGAARGLGAAFGAGAEMGAGLGWRGSDGGDSEDAGEDGEGEDGEEVEGEDEVTAPVGASRSKPARSAAFAALADSDDEVEGSERGALESGGPSSGAQAPAPPASSAGTASPDPVPASPQRGAANSAPARGAAAAASLASLPSAAAAQAQHLRAAAASVAAAAAVGGSNTDEVDASEPLSAACHVYTRDELVDFFSERYRALPPTALGSGSDAARKRKEELRQRRREEARAARREELRRRRDMHQRMVEVGLGAHVRFGDEDDARALGEDEDEDDLEGEGEGDEDELPPPLQVGMVGYPNVGKSSTINALLGATSVSHGAQRVAVAATPGKTKHFQTLRLTDEITLCGKYTLTRLVASHDPPISPALFLPNPPVSAPRPPRRLPRPRLPVLRADARGDGVQRHPAHRPAARAHAAHAPPVPAHSAREDRRRLRPEAADARPGPEREPAADGRRVARRLLPHARLHGLHARGPGPPACRARPSQGLLRGQDRLLPPAAARVGRAAGAARERRPARARGLARHARGQRPAACRAARPRAAGGRGAAGRARRGRARRGRAAAAGPHGARRGPGAPRGRREGRGGRRRRGAARSRGAKRGRPPRLFSQSGRDAQGGRRPRRALRVRGGGGGRGRGRGRGQAGQCNWLRGLCVLLKRRWRFLLQRQRKRERQRERERQRRICIRISSVGAIIRPGG